MSNLSVLVCTDCLEVVTNHDYTSLDYYYDEDDANLRREEIDAGLSRLGLITRGETSQDKELSTCPCECCGNQLHGDRHHCVTVG